jgi:hypothetical protein
VIEAVIFAAVSALLYHLGMGFVLFLIPLQAVLVRKGRRSFFISLALAFLLILGVRALLSRGAAAATPFVLLEMSVVAALIAGLVLIQLPELAALPRQRLLTLRRVPRLLAATGVAGLLSVPLILYLQGNEAFSAGLREIFGSAATALNRAFGESDSLGLVGGGQLFSAEGLQQAAGEILLRSYLFEYFLLLTGSWWAGTIIGSRSTGGKAQLTKLVDFRLGDGYVWPLIASLAMVLLSLVVHIGVLGLAAWNALLILVFLYGLSGLGIIRFLLRKYKLPAGLRWLLVLAIVILAFTPRVNLAIAILVPGLGVSEIWLKYRREERSTT